MKQAITSLAGSITEAKYFCLSLTIAGKPRKFRLTEWEYAEMCRDLFPRELVAQDDPRIAQAIAEGLTNLCNGT